MKRYCVGSQIGVHQIRLGIFEVNGEAVKLWRIDTLRGSGCKEILRQLTESLSRMMVKLEIPPESVTGIGVSVPGAVDRDGVVHYSIPLGWGIVNVPVVLQSISGIPAAVGCSRDMAVLGEHWGLNAAAPANMALFILDERIQGSLIINHHLSVSKNGFSGDLGNMSRLRKIESEICEFYHLSQYESPSAEQILDRIVHALAESVHDINCVVPLELVAICGSSKPGISAIMKRLGRVTDIAVSFARLGNDAELYGSARYVLQRGGREWQ